MSRPLFGFTGGTSEGDHGRVDVGDGRCVHYDDKEWAKIRKTPATR